MIGPLFLLAVLGLSLYLVFLIVDAGLAGPLSVWWFKSKSASKNKQASSTEKSTAAVVGKPLELRLTLPKMEVGLLSSSKSKPCDGDSPPC